MYLHTDKRTADFSIRIPEITKALLEQLSKHQKSRLNEEILVTIAKAIHNSKFQPDEYLIEDIE